jgi:hypothetical protein
VHYYRKEMSQSHADFPLHERNIPGEEDPVLARTERAKQMPRFMLALRADVGVAGKPTSTAGTDGIFSESSFKF